MWNHPTIKENGGSGPWRRRRRQCAATVLGDAELVTWIEAMLKCEMELAEWLIGDVVAMVNGWEVVEKELEIAELVSAAKGSWQEI